MKSVCRRFWLVIVLSCASTAWPQDYTRDELRIRLEGETDPAKVGKICGDFMLNSTDMEAVRMAQDNWRRADYASARLFAETWAHRFPDSARYLYLFGRLLDSPAKQIEVGRRVIDMAPDWPYGYRLVAGNYSRELFSTKETGEPQKALAHSLPRDEPYFYRLVELAPDQDYPLMLLFSLQVYQGQLEKALATIDRAQPLNSAWASPQKKANLLARMGRYRQAYATLDSALGPLVEGGMPPEEHDLTLRRMYGDALKAAGAYSQLVDYLRRQPDSDSNTETLYDLAGALALGGQVDSAISALRRASERGFDAVGPMEADPDLQTLRPDPRWTEIANRVRANWERGAPARKVASLATKFSRRAPDFTLADERGERIHLADLRGYVVVLDFWAIGCEACTASLPILSQFVRERAGPNVVVYCIQIREEDHIRGAAYMADHDYGLHLLFGTDALDRAYAFETLPYLCVIDKSGKIRFEDRGATHNLMENLTWWTEDLQ